MLVALTLGGRISSHLVLTPSSAAPKLLRTHLPPSFCALPRKPTEWIEKWLICSYRHSVWIRLNWGGCWLYIRALEPPQVTQREAPLVKSYRILCICRQFELVASWWSSRELVAHISWSFTGYVEVSDLWRFQIQPLSWAKNRKILHIFFFTAFHRYNSTRFGIRRVF